MTPDRERRYIVEIETLQEQNRQLQDLLGYRERDAALATIIQALDCSPAEAKIAYLLYRAAGRVLRKADLSYGADCKYESDLRTIDVSVCRLRKHLPEGSIRTTWGLGYSMSETGLAAIRSALGDGAEDTRI